MMEYSLTGKGRKMLKIFISAVIVSVAYAGLVFDFRNDSRF